MCQVIEMGVGNKGSRWLKKWSLITGVDCVIYVLNAKAWSEIVRLRQLGLRILVELQPGDAFKHQNHCCPK